jgi:signal transduction histidine kinase/DNA-binding response OmpR family regulator
MCINNHQLKLKFIASILVCILCFTPRVMYSQTGNTDEKTPESVEELLELVDEWIFNDPALARNYAEQALELSRETGSPEDEIKSLYVNGELLMRASNRIEALPFFEEGIEKAEASKIQTLIAKGHYHLSRYYESDANFSEAISRAQNSLTLFKELGLEPDVANTNNSLGRIYQELGDFTTSLTYLFEALRINEKLGRKTSTAVSHTIIGNIHLKNGNYDEATRHFHLALEIDEEIEDRTGIMISKLNLGAAYQRNEDYDTAMRYHEEALELARELEYKNDQAVILANIGTTYRKLGLAEESLPYMFEGLAIKRETGSNLTPTLNGITEAYLALEDYDQALTYAVEAEQSGLERSDSDRLRYTYLNMASAFEGLRDFESANRALRKYNEVRDSLFTIEREKQINELEILYETEKQDQTISMLTLEAENASFRRNTYLGSGFLISLILLLLYSGQRYKTRKNRQLLDKSEEVARMKSNFFSNISHEFRTPLTLISGPIEQIKASTDDPKIQKELSIMQKNSNRLLSLINQLLDLSRLESGSLLLSVSKSNIISLTRGVTMSFQSLAEMRQITLTTEIEAEFQEAWIDRDKLETILINLLSNAIKFSPDSGEVVVKISDPGKTDKLTWCRFEVANSGEGISKHDLEHIFDRFYRGSDSEHNGIIGSGIGLALTKELVQLHRGVIRVESSPGENTVFIVELPISEQHYSDSEKVTASTSEIKTESVTTDETVDTVVPDTQLKPNTDTEAPLLLLIEDNEDVKNYLTDILNETYRLITAPDGEAGVDLAINEIPDLIVSDVMMPKMDGYQVAETLKGNEKTSHIPLILLTAKASHDDKMQGLKTHADDYITKPFRPDELLLRVGNLITSRQKLSEKYKRKIEIKPEELSSQSMEEAFLLRVVNSIKKHIVDENFTVDHLAREVGMSRSQLHRKLVALTELSATEFIRSYRLNLAREKIENHTGSISEIAYEVGFNSPSYFSKVFKEKFGVSPSEIENGNERHSGNKA